MRYCWFLFTISIPFILSAQPSGWVWTAQFPYVYENSTGKWYFQKTVDNVVYGYDFSTSTWEVWEIGIGGDDLAIQDQGDLLGETIDFVNTDEGSSGTYSFFDGYFGAIFSSQPNFTYYGSYIYQKIGPREGTITLILDPLLSGSQIYSATQVARMFFETENSGSYTVLTWEATDTNRSYSTTGGNFTVR